MATYGRARQNNANQRIKKETTNDKQIEMPKRFTFNKRSKGNIGRLKV